MGEEATFGGPTLKKINFNKKSNLKTEKILIPEIRKNSNSEMEENIVFKNTILDLLRNNHPEKIPVGGTNSSRKNIENRGFEQRKYWSRAWVVSDLLQNNHPEKIPVGAIKSNREN